jgi:hypothetical protein
LKFLGPRAYQNAEKTKRRKPLSQRSQKKMEVMVVIMEVTTTHTESTIVDDPNSRKPVRR